MNSAINSNKQQLRQEAGSQRQALSPEFRRDADAAICRRLVTLSELHCFKMVAAFVPFGAEPDLSLFWQARLAAGVKLFLPRSIRNATGGMVYELAAVSTPETELVAGAYGIMEPAPHLPAAVAADYEKLLWLVPGVAFDSQCRRLGRGKGFYDRLLSNGRGLKIGIFYECQKLVEIPVAAHDLPLDMVVTEQTIYRR